MNVNSETKTVSQPPWKGTRWSEGGIAADAPGMYLIEVVILLIWGKRVVFSREQHEPFPLKPSHPQHEIECFPSTLRKCPRRYSVGEPKVLASRPNTRHVIPRVYICICKIFDMHLTMCNLAWRHEQSPTQGFTQGRPTQLHKALHKASKVILSARYSI